MTKREVEATLGKPDFSRSMFGPKGPGEKWLGFSWTYYLAKTGSTTNSKDPGIEVFFDTSDRAHWIVPTGIEGAREIGAPARPCARAPDNGNAADNAEIRKLKARALEGMRRYMDVVRQSGKDPGYGEAEIRRCEVILDTYVRRLSTISRGDNAQVMAATKDAVLALNKLNGETGERLIETDQREDLAMLINKAARAMGVGDGKGDITEQWREW